MRGTFLSLRFTATTSLIWMSLLTGCKNKEQVAMAQAKAQAASSHTAQQIQYIDRNGDTVTMTVQPPVQNQPQQVSVTLTPPPAGPPPKSTDPVITPIGLTGR